MDKKYLEIIVCPLCKGPLEHKEKELICARDQLAFPIDDGVPMLLEQAARPLGN